ncbi:hypothetical protein ACHAXT_001871 [Thalassiosira profunda]
MHRWITFDISPRRAPQSRGNRRMGRSSPSLTILILVVPAVLALTLWAWNQRDEDVYSSSTKIRTKQTKLGDGCYHIFLDVGANIGVHTRFLYQPELYPKAVRAREIFDQQFGASRNNSDFCSFGFEPNPAHAERHARLASAYNGQGWRYSYVNAGVSDEDGNLTFYHNQDEGQNEWGFGDHNLKGVGVPVTVPTIRFSTWLQNELLDRELPETVYGNYSTGPRVVMKMDIESSEYRVLPDLWFTGIMCQTIDFLFGEFHPWDISYKDDAITGRGGLSLRSEEATGVLRTGVKLFHSFKDCSTDIVELDDESYLHDGMPFPGATEANSVGSQ